MMLISRWKIIKRYTEYLGCASLSLLFFLTSASFPINVQAQSAQQGNGEEAAKTEIIEEIVVSGSRITRESNLDTMTPMQSVGGAELEKRGFTNVADALSEIPGFVPGQSPAGGQNNFSVGVNFANLFGLGSQRTLTLVDGNRFVTSNPPAIFSPPGNSPVSAPAGQQVDLNAIPLPLIERVEVVGVGGAPIYGSDAIAGTINVIMKDDFEGFEIQSQYGTIEQNSGEPEDLNVQMAWGSNIDDGRGNVALGLQYEDNDGSRMVRRSGDGLSELGFPKVFGPQPSFQLVPQVRDVDGDGQLDAVNQMFDDVKIVVQPRSMGGATGTLIHPNPVFLPVGGLGLTREEGEAISFFPGADGALQIDPQGNLAPFELGTPIPNNPFFTAGAPDANDRDAQQTLLSPVKRVTGMVTANYQLFDFMEAHGSFTFADVEGETLVEQEGDQNFIFAGSENTIAFPIDTPFISDQDRRTLIDLGAGDQFWISRAVQDVSDEGRSQSETNIWRFTGGIKGDFEFADRAWHYDVTVNFGESEIVATDVDFNDGRFFNAIDAIRLSDADIQSVIDADDNGINDRQGAIDELMRISGTDSTNAGDVICRAVLQAARGEIPLRAAPGGAAANPVRPNVDGCIPLDILGTAGPASAVEWVQFNRIIKSKLEQYVFTASVGGDVVDLPAGWVELVAGYEARREEGGLSVDEGSEIGIGRTALLQSTSNDFTTDEAFFELLVPAISSDMEFGRDAFGFSLIDQLTFEGAARVIDNSLTGTDTVWTSGGRLAFGGIFSDVLIRGNFTQSTRSPSLEELFSPATKLAGFADDPCDFRFRDDGPAPENRQANCNQVGLGPDFASRIVNSTVDGETGGNPNLGAETADAWTAGVVYTPRQVPGMDLTVDWINIEISNRIATLGLTRILEACFDQDPAQFDPNESICLSFERNASGQIVDFRTGFQNAATSDFEAIQINANYEFSLTDAVTTFVSDNLGRYNWGHVELSARAFKRIANELSVVGERAPRTIGGFNEPEWNGTFDLTWTRGPLRGFWRVRWQNRALLDPEGDQFFEDRAGNLVTHTDARIISDASLAYTFLDHLTAQISVNNIFSRGASDLELAAPPDFAGGHFGLDEIFGRQFTFRVTGRF